MNIAFIGLGNMGAPMAHHLANAGHTLTVYNRSPNKAQNWITQHPDQAMALTAQDTCKQCEVLILCVGNDHDVEELLFGAQGVASNLNKNALVIDHSTTSSELAQRMHTKLNSIGIHYVDAPVSGGEKGAIDGKLTIMCGGDTHAVQRTQDISQCYCASFAHMGESGAGQLTKMVNQICVTGLIQALAEGIHFGQKAGLDINKVMALLSSGAASSWQMRNRFESMNKGEFDFGFAVDLMRKDLGICLDSAEKIEANLPITHSVKTFYDELHKQGNGKLDTSSLILRLNKG